MSRKYNDQIYGNGTSEKPETREVIQLFKRRKRLSRDLIQRVIGAQSHIEVAPFIVSLRTRGLVITSEKHPKRPREVKMYVYQGMGERKTGKYKSHKKERYVRDDVLKKVPCMMCGANVSFYVLKDDPVYDTRRMCQACKDKAETRKEDYQLCEGSNGERGGVELSRRISELVAATRKREREKIKHYKPGDPEFEKIAAQCTPPNRIEDRHGSDVVPLHKF